VLVVLTSGMALVLVVVLVVSRMASVLVVSGFRGWELGSNVKGAGTVSSK
jgi:hypothetical protein